MSMLQGCHLKSVNDAHQRKKPRFFRNCNSWSRGQKQHSHFWAREASCLPAVTTGKWELSREFRGLGEVLSPQTTKSSNKGHVTNPYNLLSFYSTFSAKGFPEGSAESSSPLLLGVSILCNLGLWSGWLPLPLLLLLLPTHFQQFQLGKETYFI